MFSDRCSSKVNLNTSCRGYLPPLSNFTPLIPTPLEFVELYLHWPLPLVFLEAGRPLNPSRPSMPKTAYLPTNLASITSVSDLVHTHYHHTPPTTAVHHFQQHSLEYPRHNPPHYSKNRRDLVSPAHESNYTRQHPCQLA